MTERAARIAVALGFVISLVAFHQADVRFDSSPLLRNDLASSLWSLHAQPPLLNAFPGLVLKLGGGDAARLFHLV